MHGGSNKLSHIKASNLQSYFMSFQSISCWLPAELILQGTAISWVKMLKIENIRSFRKSRTVGCRQIINGVFFTWIVLCYIWSILCCCVFVAQHVSQSWCLPSLATETWNASLCQKVLYHLMKGKLTLVWSLLEYISLTSNWWVIREIMGHM